MALPYRSPVPRIWTLSHDGDLGIVGGLNSLKQSFTCTYLKYLGSKPASPAQPNPVSRGATTASDGHVVTWHFCTLPPLLLVVHTLADQCLL